MRYICQSDYDFGMSLPIKLHKEKGKCFSRDLILFSQDLTGSSWSLTLIFCSCEQQLQFLCAMHCGTTVCTKQHTQKSSRFRAHRDLIILNHILKACSDLVCCMKLGHRLGSSVQFLDFCIHVIIPSYSSSSSVTFQVQPHGTSLYCSDLLDDAGCVALLVVGFLLLTPLLVLALAAFCRLARHLQLGLCFIPYSRAVYKNLPASRHRGGGAGGCCGQQGASDREGKGSVWV